MIKKFLLVLVIVKFFLVIGICLADGEDFKVIPRHEIMIKKVPIDILMPVMPDLVITNVKQTGVPKINNSGSPEVPISVTVKNIGNFKASIFKVAVYFRSHMVRNHMKGPFVVAFKVPGQSNMWYPYSVGTIAPEASITFNGNLIFHPYYRHKKVTIWAEADSCSGDEFKPSYCRVKESNENNNKSTPISIVLP